jgi:hypothetical protein
MNAFFYESITTSEQIVGLEALFSEIKITTYNGMPVVEENHLREILKNSIWFFESQSSLQITTKYIIYSLNYRFSTSGKIEIAAESLLGNGLNALIYIDEGYCLIEAEHFPNQHLLCTLSLKISKV